MSLEKSIDNLASCVFNLTATLAHLPIGRECTEEITNSDAPVSYGNSPCKEPSIFYNQDQPTAQFSQEALQQAIQGVSDQIDADAATKPFSPVATPWGTPVEVTITPPETVDFAAVGVIMPKERKELKEWLELHGVPFKPKDGSKRLLKLKAETLNTMTPGAPVEVPVCKGQESEDIFAATPHPPAAKPTQVFPGTAQPVAPALPQAVAPTVAAAMVAKDISVAELQHLCADYMCLLNSRGEYGEATAKALITRWGVATVSELNQAQLNETGVLIKKELMAGGTNG